jgi:membrane protein
VASSRGYSRAADRPAGHRSPWAVVTRVISRYREGQMTDHAAALTYYAMMSLFPALLLLVTILGLVGQQSLVTDIVDHLRKQGADSTTVDALEKVLNGMIRTSSGALGVTLVVALGLALNGMSGAFGAAGRALNVIYGLDDQRGLVRRKTTDLLVALVVVLLAVVGLVAVFLGGHVVDDLFGKIGLGSTAATIWKIARWPLAVVAIMVAFSLVYAYAPAVEPRRVRWLSPGAIVGVTLWIVVSIGFSFYVRNFSHYSTVYGVFGAAIILLLYLYIAANAFLLGGELNRELS